MPDYLQEDLFGQVAAELAEQAHRRELRRRFETIKHRRPDTGDNLGAQVWCGRCGATVANEFLVELNHEMGWIAGCYLRFRPGAVQRWSDHVSEAQRADRWDRRFFPDCARCGHPWGLHGWDIGGGGHHQYARCQALLSGCGCRSYAPTR